MHISGDNVRLALSNVPAHALCMQLYRYIEPVLFNDPCRPPDQTRPQQALGVPRDCSSYRAAPNLSLRFSSSLITFSDVRCWSWHEKEDPSCDQVERINAASAPERPACDQQPKPPEPGECARSSRGRHSNRLPRTLQTRTLPTPAVVTSQVYRSIKLFRPGG